MNKTTLTKDRVCTVLREKLYSMADNENTNEYEPLQLKWVLPVESTQGLISLYENIISVLGFVQKNECNRGTIDKIIENDVRPMVSGLSNEYDFFIAATIIIMCSMVDDFSDPYGLMKVILVKILAKQKNSKDPFYFTTNQMWKLLGMINNNYKNISLDELNDRIPEYDVKPFDVKKFYQRCNQRLRDILFSSLDRLESRALIKYDREIVIVFYDEDNHKISLPANDQQKKKILKAERRTLLDMGLESKRHVYASFKDTEFFERMNAYLQEWYGKASRIR